MFRTRPNLNFNLQHSTFPTVQAFELHLPTRFDAVADYCVKTYGNGTSIDDDVLILQMTETQTPRS